MTDVTHANIGNLRPLLDDDLAMMLAWRNKPNVRANMYTQHEISLAEHTAWWARTKQKSSQRYFIFECAGQPCGVVSFNDLNVDSKTSFWAFYSGPNAPKGAGTRMEFLALEYYFKTLKMHKLSCEVLGFNTPVLNLHSKFGFQQEGYFKEHVLLNHCYVDVLRLALFSSNWQEVRNKMRAQIMQRISS